MQTLKMEQATRLACEVKKDKKNNSHTKVSMQSIDTRHPIHNRKESHGSALPHIFQQVFLFLQRTPSHRPTIIFTRILL